MLKRLSVLTLVSVAGLLVGCGQKGPLYLPAPSERQVETRPEVKQAQPAASTSEQVVSPAKAD